MRGNPILPKLAPCALLAAFLCAQAPKQVDLMGFTLPAGEWRTESGKEYSSSQGQTRSLVGKWQRTAASFTDWRAGSSQGYIRWLYDFKADGSYTFASKSWPMNGDRMYYRRESGTYRFEGESLTLSPKRGVSESWTKQRARNNDPDKLISTQASPLETTRYRMAWHYWEGIQEWNLVLMADQPTARDGTFSTNTTYPNAWYYKSVGSSATVE